ncbi:MAG TPA: hypothetical protein VGP68_23275 [Gemmataceae bacterium]|jgi:hypothetical protein|nr:hypothetical protein [Gemmataceae bacterium]
MAPAVAIASCAQFAGTEKEDHQVIAVLGQRGLTVAHAAWDDPFVDWSSFALVVIRSTWDYPQRIDEFLAWASRLPRVSNPWPILKWNTDKRYLNDLSRAGVPVIPTCFLEPGEDFEPPSEVYVVKPAISCGAKDTARYQAGQECQARAHVQRLQAGGRTVMIQPYLAGIESTGEISMMFIGGHYSHSVCRGAMLNDKSSFYEISYPPNVRPYEATPADHLLADQVMANIPGGSNQLLFARIDLIPGPAGKPLLLEAELTEPYLFLDFKPGGAERLADGIMKELASVEQVRKR